MVTTKYPTSKCHRSNYTHIPHFTRTPSNWGKNRFQDIFKILSRNSCTGDRGKQLWHSPGCREGEVESLVKRLQRSISQLNIKKQLSWQESNLIQKGYGQRPPASHVEKPTQAGTKVNERSQ